MEQNHVLTIKTKDEKGLIHRITKILDENGLNIISNGEFVDKDSGVFFMRVEVTGEIEIDNIQNKLKKTLGEDIYLKINHTGKKDIVILVTKEAHCLGDFLIKNYMGKLNANIRAIISNHNDLEELATKFDIPYHFISAESFGREEHENKVSKVIDLYNPDIIVLAKYMRILTQNIVDKYEGKMINIHHSFLPAFIGANPYKQAYERGVKIIGATAHIVTKDLDEGPIISQGVKEVNHTDKSWRQLQEKGQSIEKNVLGEALKLMLEDRVFITGNKTIIL